MIGGRGPMVALVGMAGLLLILAIVSGWRGTSRLTSRSDDTHAVEEAATAFVEAYGTFDFRAPESYQERLLGLTTGPVRSAVLESDVDPAALGQQRTTSTSVTSVEVTALTDHQATASVTSEQTRRVVDPTSGALRREVTENLSTLGEAVVFPLSAAYHSPRGRVWHRGSLSSVAGQVNGAVLLAATLDRYIQLSAV